MDTISIILLTTLLTWMIEKSADGLLFLIIQWLRDKSKNNDDE